VNFQNYVWEMDCAGESMFVRITCSPIGLETTMLDNFYIVVAVILVTVTG